MVVEVVWVSMRTPGTIEARLLVSKPFWKTFASIGSSFGTIKSHCSDHLVSHNTLRPCTVESIQMHQEFPSLHRSILSFSFWQLLPPTLLAENPTATNAPSVAESCEFFHTVWCTLGRAKYHTGKSTNNVLWNDGPKSTQDGLHVSFGKVQVHHTVAMAIESAMQCREFVLFPKSSSPHACRTNCLHTLPTFYSIKTNSSYGISISTLTSFSFSSSISKSCKPIRWINQHKTNKKTTKLNKKSRMCMITDTFTLIWDFVYTWDYHNTLCVFVLHRQEIHEMVLDILVLDNFTCCAVYIADSNGNRSVFNDITLRINGWTAIKAKRNREND